MWAVSIIVRFIAIWIGIARNAPFAWISWAAVYLATGLALRACDLMHWGGPTGAYVTIWIIQQIAIVFLGWLVVKQAAQPTGILVAISAVASAFIGLVTVAARLYPGSPLEPAMVICGLAALALGIISGVEALAHTRMDSGIVAIFFLLYSLLMLSGAEFLAQPQLGRAWSILEIATFGAWAVIWLAAGRQENSRTAARS